MSAIDWIVCGYLLSVLITFPVEACTIANDLAYDRRRLESTPGFIPETTWFSLIWALVRAVCPVLNSIMALCWLCERIGDAVDRLDRPILKRRHDA